MTSGHRSRDSSCHWPHACTCTCRDVYLEVSVCGASELLEVEVQHKGYLWNHLRSKKWFPDLLSDDVEESHYLHGQCEVELTLLLIL